jgi:heme exporter protein B
LELIREIRSLIQKDIVLEWRQKYALSGMLLFVVSTVFLCYMSFKLKTNNLEPITWNTLFWLIMLFAAFNTINRSFGQEKSGRQLYMFQLASPEAIILAKIFYNVLLMSILTLIAFVLYSAFMGDVVQNLPQYVLAILMGGVGFSSSLTLMAGIASKSDNSAGLMAVLSFPIILPMIVLLIKLSKNAMDGLDFSASYDELMLLGGIDLIVITLSYILFPYLWKS